MTRKKAPVSTIRSARESEKVLGSRPIPPGFARHPIALAFIQISAPVFARCPTESWILLL